MSRAYRRRVTTAVAVTAALSIPMGSAHAAHTGCPPGFSEPGAVTLQAYLDAPRHAAGLEAGRYTEDDLTVRFGAIDANGNGVICTKAVSNLTGNSGRNWGFFYLAGDDD